MTLVWIGAALLLALIEVFVVDLFFLSLAASSLLGGISAFFGAPVWAQVTIFVVFALLSLFLVRPWARRQLARSTPNIEMNVRGLVGKTATVLQPLQGDSGRVRLEGEEWSARGVQGMRFPVGSEVKVVAIEGAVAIVGPAY